MRISSGPLSLLDRLSICDDQPSKWLGHPRFERLQAPTPTAKDVSALVSPQIVLSVCSERFCLIGPPNPGNLQQSE